MLQIIGWLGCVYLLLRSLQMAYSRDMKDEQGRMTSGAQGLVIAGVIASLGFAVWFGIQGADIAASAPAPLTADEMAADQLRKCIENPYLDGCG